MGDRARPGGLTSRALTRLTGNEATTGEELVHRAKRLTYIFAACLGICAALLPYITSRGGEGIYTIRAIYTNAPVILILGTLIVLLVRNMYVGVIERGLLGVAVTFVLVWDVIHLVTDTLPHHPASNRNGLALVGCIMIALTVSRRLALPLILAFYGAHSGLIWWNLLNSPWSATHVYNIDDSIMSTILMTLIGIVATLQLAVGRSSQQADVLRHMALTDSLTQLPNRRAMMDHLEANPQCCVVLLDLDNFKAINDEQGHAVGDDVLVDVSMVLTNHMCGRGAVGRWGGEEFLAVFPALDEATVLRVMDDVQQEMRNLPFRVPITFSGGVAERQPEESIDSVLSRVDTLMYVAKRAGKNRCFASGCAAEADEDPLTGTPGGAAGEKRA